MQNHNSFSHATNDCNVFRRQVQSALNEGRLSLTEMQVDKTSFSMHMVEARAPTVLIRPEQANKAQGKKHDYRRTTCSTECRKEFGAQGGA